MNEWSEYYLLRVNNQNYFQHFSQKYGINIYNCIKRFHKSFSKNTIIIEEGCGIGNVTKYLVNFFPTNQYILCDNDDEMLELAKQNLKNQINCSNITFLQKDILSSNIIASNPKDDVLVITHGVLEHFGNLQLIDILKTVYTNKFSQLHYVPLEGYLTPSFGDERLLPKTLWRTLCLTIFNNVKDLCINKQDLYFYIDKNTTLKH